MSPAGPRSRSSRCRARTARGRAAGSVCGISRGCARLPRPGPRDAAVTEPSSGIAQFTGSAFGSAAIWQYESLKSRVQTYFEEARADWMDKMRPQKRGDFRKQVHGARPGLLAQGWMPAGVRGTATSLLWCKHRLYNRYLSWFFCCGT